jgi:hypothetical protein
MKYKRGDKVKIVGNTCCHRHAIGSIGIILDDEYKVDVGGEIWWCNERDLAKAKEKS